MGSTFIILGKGYRDKRVLVDAKTTGFRTKTDHQTRALPRRVFPAETRGYYRLICTYEPLLTGEGDDRKVVR